MAARFKSRVTQVKKSTYKCLHECSEIKRQAKHDSHWSRFVIDDLQIFALTSISFNDLPFLYERMGGSLNISLSTG